MESFKEIKKLKTELAKQKKMLEENEKEVSKMEENINNTLNKLNKVESEKIQQNNAMQQFYLDKKALMEDKDNFFSALEQKKISRQFIADNLEKLNSSKTSFEKEKKSEFSSLLNQVEKEEIDVLPSEINQIKENDLSVVFNDLSLVDRQINEKNNTLKNNLFKRKQQMIFEQQNTSLNNVEQQSKL